MIKKWEELVSGDGSLELDGWPDLHDLASDAIARAAFGTSYEQGKRVFHLQRELADLVIHTILSTYIPGWRFLPTKNNRRMKELDKQIIASLKDMVSRRENEMKSGEATNADLLSTLIESNWNEVREQGDDINARMSINDVLEECRAFHLAGQETTSCLMVWMMIVLAMHPNWQARAREEVLQIFGSGKPHFSGLSQLKVVTMIIYEVLRCYPPVEGTYRIVHRDTKLGDYLLPAGVLLYLPILFVHRDKELWGEDASEFNPERFANGVSNAAKDQQSFFPFAWGPRTCIGLSYALLQTKLALAMILQSFSFELSASYIHAPYSLLTIRPQHGAHLVFHKLA